MDGESRRPKIILWLLSPAPVLSQGFAGVVLFELTASGLRAVAEPEHQRLDPCCQDTGRTGLLSPTEWAAPLYRSFGPGTLSREYIRRRRCPSGWGRLGGCCSPARGAFGAGLLEGAGLQSPPSGSLFSREIFFPFPLYCAKPAPRKRCSPVLSTG